MARIASRNTKLVNSAIAGTLGFLMFFPIIWILILSFKTEENAIRAPLEILFHSGWTMDSFATVQARSDYLKHFSNSVIIALGSTFIGLLVAIPAAWSMAFVPSKKHEKCVNVDAFNQNAATGWSFGSNLSAVSRFQPSGHTHWADHCADVDQFADNYLDALYVFQRNPC